MYPHPILAEAKAEAYKPTGWRRWLKAMTIHIQNTETAQRVAELDKIGAELGGLALGSELALKCLLAVDIIRREFADGAGIETLEHTDPLQ